MNIEDLISHYIDGDLSSEAEAEMHHRLAVSPEARRLFRAQIALRGIARNPRVLHTPASELRAKLFERLEREEGMKPVAAPLPAPPAEARADARPIASPVADVRGRRRRRAIAWLMPTVVASIIAVAILWNPGEPMIQEGGPTVANDYRPGPAAPGVTSQSAPAENSSVENSSAGNAPVERQAPVTGAAPSVESAQATAADAAPRRAAQGNIAPVESRRAYNSSSRSAASTMRTGSIAAMSDQEGSPTIASADLAPESADLMPPSESLGASNANAAPRTLAMAKSSSPSKTSSDHAKGKFEDETPIAMGGGAKVDPERSGGGRGERLMNQSGRDGFSTDSRTAVPPPPPASAPSDHGRAVVSSDTAMGEKVMTTQGVSADHAPVQTSPPLASSRSVEEQRSVFLIADPLEPGFMVTVYQGSFIAAEGGTMEVDLAVRGGMQFPGGHMVFVTAGAGGYRRSVSDSIIRVTNNGATSYPGLPATSLSEGSHEFFAGAGYRYTISLSRSWGIGGGVSGSVGTHYLRGGIETSVTYRPTGWLRLEVIPTIRYSAVHGGSSVTTGYRPLPGGAEQEFQQTVTPGGDGTLDVGVGVGASVVW